MTKKNNGKASLAGFDKYLPLWIFLAMAVGVSIGYFKPDAPSTIRNNTTGHTDFFVGKGLIFNASATTNKGEI